MHIITLILILTLITLITLITLNILLKLLYLMYVPFHLATVVDDDDGQRGHDEEHRPPRSQTPPTPPVHAGSSQSPPPSARPMRQRCMAQLRPVSIQDIVRDMAGTDPVQRIQDFDMHYMPDGQPAPEASSRGTSDAHRAELKTNATGFRRSLSEVFAYLTHGTASLEKARRILSIITNVHVNCNMKIMNLISFITLVYIITFLFL